MEPLDLELISTQQLIDELMRRKTFLGVVIHSVEEHRGEAWLEERIFRMHFNENLGSAEAGRLLETIAEQINLGLV